jgi:precorrin-6A synthase
MPVKRLLVVGIGAGDPEDLTARAVEAIREADVFFAFDKGDHAPALLRARTELCARVAGDHPHRFVTITDAERDRRAADYARAVETWHASRVERLRDALDHELPDGGCGAILVWGDPGMYDSTIRLVATLAARSPGDLEYEVVPGISSIQLLAARHGISLHRVGGSLLITTGRALRVGIPPGIDDIVVMLDGECSFTVVEQPERFEIAWGAYLGTPDEILVAGNLAAVGDEIQRVRSEARARLGWIMDVYLLRRIDGPSGGDPCES